MGTEIATEAVPEIVTLFVVGLKVNDNPVGSPVTTAVFAPPAIWYAIGVIGVFKGSSPLQIIWFCAPLAGTCEISSFGRTRICPENDSSSHVPFPVAVTVKVYVVGVATSTIAFPEIITVFPIIGPSEIPFGKPEPLALVELPLTSNVIFVKAPFSQIVWFKVVETDVTLILAFGVILILPTWVTGAQVPDVVIV